MKQRNFFQKKVSHNPINLLDIDNILDEQQKDIFFKNISFVKQKDSKPNEKSKSNTLSDYLKNGRLDYSLESNSQSNKEENKKEENAQKTIKKQNFILKSELFNFSPDASLTNRSEVVSPKSPFLKCNSVSI